jgi:hypothetical protein
MHTTVQYSITSASEHYYKSEKLYQKSKKVDDCIFWFETLMFYLEQSDVENKPN